MVVRFVKVGVPDLSESDARTLAHLLIVESRSSVLQVTQAS